MSQLPATRRSQGGSMASRREHPLQRLARDFDTLFNRMWGGSLAPLDQDLDLVRVWDFDVTENDKEIVVRAEMPGFEENEIDVQINNDTLTIKAEKEQKGDGQQEYRSFYRVVTLPPGIDAEKAQASYRNGVLELHVPRAAGAQARRIQVQGQQAPAGQAGATSSQAANQGHQSAKQSATAASEKAKK